MRVDRRELLKAASGFVLFAGLPLRGVLAQAPRQYPFTLGIAAGDPAPDGFVIWTRLAPRPLEPHGGMEPQPVVVAWEVAEDEAFSRIVRSGEVIARPELGHSVHVEVEGLRPARPYYYRFLAGTTVSDTGTARSAPPPGAAVGRVRIGVAGCQRYTSGYFTAYRYLATEGDLDAIFHYGDYIYEGGARRGCAVVDGQTVCVREHDSDEIYSLDDYRHRYALYKLDPDLQAAHRAAAFLSTFDDHEVDNNWTSQWDENGTPPEVFLLRRFAALQAWYENMPVRRTQFPANGQLRMFRRIDYGSLLRIHLLDTRQYRSDQRCNMPGDRNCRSADDTGLESVLGRIDIQDFQKV
ncbi:alkaline phosphatase D family protein [Sphingobium nicotianae]|uniref:Alkaline phosphatase D family protein n=1 Tax=Sphingobium nicotianae TaxID=2782607 RepID=A0A9X1DF81_9SPHN|nr:alkaline phosphatase D family protein [Sphingobium nicotianae]MBT2188814.1 alkaline phosphatase D family protein [Sphingobium nicotianae]